MIRVLVLLLLAALAIPGAASAAGNRSHHFHHRTVIVGSAFYFGSPWYPYGYYYPPYYYGPSYEATSTPPSIYVEKFEGTPDADSGDIYCPSLGQYYPDAHDCPNGWQRIIGAGAGAGP
ncbi:MAG: hypothetical protein JOZ85_12180 [Betaproteobacteria bacterium]|nr:hypothetical protein [Betaproteobacteria bacterium]